jgi:hypothetical protein
MLLNNYFDISEMNHCLKLYLKHSKPLFGQHLIWKIKYYLLLLLRFNIIKYSYKTLIIFI